MAIEIWELPESGDVSAGDDGVAFSLKFAATGSDNKLSILQEILIRTDIVPTEISGIPRRDVRCNVIPGHTEDWEIFVDYSQLVGGTLTPSQVGEERESFSTGSVSNRMYQALEHIADYAAPGRDIVNHKGAINVTPNGVEGVDVESTVWIMRIDKVIDSVDMTTILRQNIFQSTNAVNSDAFRGFQPGELKLVRADANPQDEETWYLSYEFIASQNLQDLTLGEITGIVKDGQDYIWGEYEDIIVGEGTSSARSAKKLTDIHIERIWPRVPFTGRLGI